MATMAAAGLWLLASIASVWVWLPPRPGHGRPLLSRTPVLVVTVAVLTALTAGVAVLASAGDPLSAALRWPVFGVAGLAALLTGGAVTSCVLGLADVASRPTPQRISRTVLRGGAWIGALERLAILAVLLARWPEGIAVIVAVKGLARYPELKSQSTGAAERFIIGTFASIGWAAACAGITLLMI